MIKLPFSPLFTVLVAGIVVTGARSAQGQSITTLKTVAKRSSIAKWNSIQHLATGISIYIPSGEITPDETFDAVTGAKMASIEITSRQASSYYMLVAVRANPAMLTLLRKKQEAGQNPLDVLYEQIVKPKLDSTLKDALQGHNVNTKSRKPLSWRGMQGEEIVTRFIAPGAKTASPSGVLKIRILKSEDSFFFIAGTESKQDADSNRRIGQFFESFTFSANPPLTSR